MKRQMMGTSISRRTLLKLGAGMMGGLAASSVLRAYGIHAQTPEPGATAVAPLSEKERLDQFYATVELIPDSDIIVDGSKYKKPGPYRVGLSNGFSGNAWRKMMMATLELEVKTRPDEISEYIVVDGQGDDAKQVNDIESLISQEVDILLIDPNSGTAVAPALKKAMDAGILVAVFDLEVVGEDYTFYVATNPVPAAEKFARFLAERIGKGGKIVALGGIPGNTYTAAGWAAAEPILKEAGIEVLAFKDAWWEEDRAKVIMSDLIAAYPQIDGVWCDGMQVCTGATKALMAANRPLVPVTGDDYNGILRIYDEMKDKEPKFDFICITTATWQGALALRLALDMMRDGKSFPKRQIIEGIPVTKENYLDFYMKGMPDAVSFHTPLSREMLMEIFGAQ